AGLIAEFKEAYGNVDHVTYDAISEDAALSAFEAKYGERALADYNFANAEVIVSFGADFLGDWQGGGYDSGYAKGRVPVNGKMSSNVQFDADRSLTGANADKRVPLTPSEQKVALAYFYVKLNGTPLSSNLPASAKAGLDAVAAQMLKNRSSA